LTITEGAVGAPEPGTVALVIGRALTLVGLSRRARRRVPRA